MAWAIATAALRDVALFKALSRVAEVLGKWSARHGVGVCTWGVVGCAVAERFAELCLVGFKGQELANTAWMQATCASFVF